jgi:CheY-like chemotaxis protein
MRILIVEKSLLDLQRMAAALGKLGCQVEGATGLSEARQLLKRGTCSLLLLAQQEDDPQGTLGLLRELPDLAPGTLSVFITHDGGLRDYQQALKLGAVDVLVRPFSEEEIVDTVLRAMDCLSGFRGSVHGVSLVDLLQLFHLSRRSTLIEVRGADGQGVIAMDKGYLVHAELDGITGEDALVLLLAMEGGSLRSLPYREAGQSIQGPFQEVLFEALRRLDEGDLPNLTYSRRKLAVRSPVPSCFPTSALPPGDLRLVALKEHVRELDPELSLGLVSGVRCYPLLPGNLGDGVLIGLGGRFLARLPPLAPGWSQLQRVAGRGGLGLLGGRCAATFLAAKRWQSSSDERYFRRNLAKIEQYLQRELPAVAAPGIRAVG